MDRIRKSGTNYPRARLRSFGRDAERSVVNPKRHAANVHAVLSALLGFSIAILSPNNSPALGEIGAWYFDTLKQSQVWINLEPQGSEPGANPVRLNITVSFAGRSLEQAPGDVELRAESITGTFPLTIRQPVFRIALDSGAPLDFTGPGRTFQFVSRCPECAADTLIVRVPFKVVRDAAASRTVVVEALGFSTRMKPADITALRRFVETVGKGVAVR